MYRADARLEMSGRAHRFELRDDDRSLSVAEVLGLWQQSETFRSFFIRTLAESAFTTFRWETPPLTADTVGRHFEFVLVNAPPLDRRPDANAFRRQFTDDGHGIAVFTNLGGDATMIVPSPRTSPNAYPHLAAFVRNAPAAQAHSLWETIGQEVHKRLGDQPLWLSTAGGGVAWLHVRLDSRPKYYAYAPYKTPP